MNATLGGANQAFRTDDDLLVGGGAPDPDQRPRDEGFSPEDFRSQFLLQLQLDPRDHAVGGDDIDARIRRARWIGSWKPEALWGVRAAADIDEDNVSKILLEQVASSDAELPAGA